MKKEIAEIDQNCIKINDQWQICFVLEDNGASNVERIDYH